MTDKEKRVALLEYAIKDLENETIQSQTRKIAIQALYEKIATEKMMFDIKMPEFVWEGEFK